jgi:cytochrome c biogenesis protein CcmG/thiol:disulfide interchange protein DsbE
VICGFLARGLQLNPKSMPSVQVGKHLPTQSFQLWGQSKPQQFSKWQGELIILHFWATWCDSCQADILQLEQLHQKTNAILLGVNYKDKTKALQEWMFLHPDVFSDIILDKEGRLGLDLGVVATPETFIIDSKGVIRSRFQGPITEQLIEQQIIPLLEEYSV